MRKLLLWLLPCLLFTHCKKEGIENPDTTSATLYFPPHTANTWETVAPASLGWNTAELETLYTYLQQKGTKAFIILKEGRIAAERYFGAFTAESPWYWASAGKTATAFLVGIAQHEGKLALKDKTGQYLGTGWTGLSAEKENMITIRHQLTMTTGLDDGTGYADCTEPPCLQYKEDAGTRWAYHNAPYTLLEKVVETATGVTYNQYFSQKVKDPIGMSGQWVKSGYNNVYVSNARSMARFGLLLLNKGRWAGNPVLPDKDYMSAMTGSSQNLNPAYGYLTWLNGKATYRMPQTQFLFNGPLVPAAPADMYAALGKNDQKLYVVPSQNLVIVRMGESAGNTYLAASTFDNELWQKLRPVLKW